MCRVTVLQRRLASFSSFSIRQQNIIMKPGSSLSLNSLCNVGSVASHSPGSVCLALAPPVGRRDRKHTMPSVTHSLISCIMWVFWGSHHQFLLSLLHCEGNILCSVLAGSSLSRWMAVIHFPTLLLGVAIAAAAVCCSALWLHHRCHKIKTQTESSECDVTRLCVNISPDADLKMSSELSATASVWFSAREMDF